ncbi:MAG TPA: FoF1 ATP synthase subunit gamma [Candidatus Babeliales bacterium]|nr:FoF1 ATP synthase subunit gamma [Candidatus Babeliales bacterium]
MTQLVQIRQRIKAIETTKKMTHAMRLIAMSNHTNLRSKESSLKSYQESLSNLFALIKHGAPDWTPKFEHPDGKKKTLLILIGSQKGLCGTFNTMLFRYFSNHYETNGKELYDFIMVGRKALEYAEKKDITAVESLEDLTVRSLGSMTQELTDYLYNNLSKYTKIIVFRNISQSFFNQVPEKTTIFPTEVTSSDEQQDLSNYVWEEPIETVLQHLCLQNIQASIQLCLFQSLYAEQAARFQSMDSATRNASDLLEATQRQYNKLRQAKITKELSELNASFSK